MMVLEKAQSLLEICPLWRIFLQNRAMLHSHHHRHQIYNNLKTTMSVAAVRRQPNTVVPLGLSLRGMAIGSLKDAALISNFYFKTNLGVLHGLY